MQDIQYYKINEVLTHKYYQIPQELFSNELYKDNLNSDSKILYGFLLDRLTLSQKHNWVDKNGNIYLIFTREEVKNKLGLCEKTVIKAFKQLSAVNLILEKRQGQGKPNLIYVGKIKHEPVEKFIEEENMQLQNCTNYSSKIVDDAVLKLNNLQGINTNNINTDIINTYSINPHNKDGFISLQEVKEKSKLYEFENEDKYILEDVINKLYYADNLKVGAVNISSSKILSKLELITKDNLIQLSNIIKSSGNIKNLTNYLMICLYNNLGNTCIKTTMNNTTNKISNRFFSRDYSKVDFDETFANLISRQTMFT